MGAGTELASLCLELGNGEIPAGLVEEDHLRLAGAYFSAGVDEARARLLS